MTFSTHMADWVDIGIFVLIALSALVGLVRGLVREALALTTWIAAAAFAALYFKKLAPLLPFSIQSQVARLILAGAIIFFGVLILGAFINHLFTSAVSAIGLGGIDHFLGSVFGGARGVIIVILAVILMDLTTLPNEAWWKESRLLGWFSTQAQQVKGMIPEEFASYLEKGGAAVMPPSSTPAPATPEQAPQ
ncbi:CvpA family protein [Thiolinea disciformis]|uniref:CvpA family protein n=1 Tax=Thiolinea disciformis TaxID=125614 RepID=UPI00037C1DA1|nr:CvpA family protein [Thiolinea disciformis]